jgi:hypothetical protein
MERRKNELKAILELIFIHLSSEPVPVAGRHDQVAGFLSLHIMWLFLTPCQISKAEETKGDHDV